MNKKSTRLWIVAASMVILTACGLDKDHVESATRDGQEIQREELGVESMPSGTDESAHNAPEYVYEADVIRYSEPSGEFSLRKDVEVTRTDYAAYYFETSIGMVERNACIAVTDQALSCIDAALPEIEIVVLSPEFYDGVLVSGNRLYTPVESWDSVDYIAKVLLAGYGEWSNYGMAYGYADYLCRKAGIGSGEANSDGRKEALEDGEEVSDDWDTVSGGRETASGERENRRFLQAGVPESYDLTLLCLDENFMPAEDVEAAKNNACLFVDEYLSVHSEKEFLELLSLSGTSEGVERANEALEAFYEEHGVECCLTKIRYQYGGVTFDYAAACEYARFYISVDWQDETWETNPKVSENFLHENYGEIRAFFECNARQMGQYQEMFGFESYNNDLAVMFSNGARKSALMDSYYSGEDHLTCVSSVVSLMHEYVHSVMAGRCDWTIRWKWEGFARYYESQHNAYAYDFWNYDYNNQPENEMGIRIRKYIDWLGRPFDSKTDSWEMANVIVYACEYTDPNVNYTTGESFIGYLVKRYGEQETIAYVCSNDDYNSEWGKTYVELVQDWNEYINRSYSWYGAEQVQ